MKNKLRKPNLEITWILSLLYVFAVFMLLNSCSESSNNKVNKLEAERPTFKEVKKICPACQGGSRYLFKVNKQSEDQKPNLVLLCEECYSAWISPRATEWKNIASKEELKKEFSVKRYRKLFDEGASWVTIETAKQSDTWREFVKDTESKFIK